jgi:nucleotide-binding universal stress UspA family protein
MHRFKGNQSKVCVAIKFDEPDHAVMRTAEQFCLQTGSAMHLVHICENAVTRNLSALTSNGVTPLPVEIIQLAQEKDIHEAETQMARLVAGVHRGIKVSAKVIDGTSGFPADLIEAEANESNSHIIVLGTTINKRRFVPRGFSCALTLVSMSKLPVLVVNHNQLNQFDAEHFHLLVADDLKESSIPALKGGLEIAKAIGNTKLSHVHVNNVTLDVLRMAINVHNAPIPRAMYDQQTLNEIYEIRVQELRGKLKQRAAQVDQDLLKSCYRYDQLLVTEGSVAETLEKFVTESKVNLVAMGRHHTFHQRPFSLGKMPFYAMLTLPCPVIVFPSSQN